MTGDDRDVRTQNELTFKDKYRGFSASNRLGCSCKQFLLETFPIVEWIQEYQFKRDFPKDLTAGITVTILQIPQGIAYGSLANVPSICGIYTAFFTGFVYFIFGSSRHNNLGTFAVVCLMVGQVVAKHVSLDEHRKEPNTEEGTFTNIEVLSAINFTVSMYLLSMYILRLGVITAILSQTLTNAFTSACAIQLIFSQIKDLFGLNIKMRTDEFFKIGFLTYDVCKNITKANYIASSMAAIAMIVLLIYNEIIKVWLSKKYSFPFPIELVVIIVSTTVTQHLEFNKKYGVPIIGPIPTGLPYPMVPSFHIMKYVALDCLPIAIVSYIITISFGFIFARKGSYKISPNQEFLALGLMNLLGSFFLCIPVSTSASRTMVQYKIGAVSQFATFVSSILLLFVLLYVGPLLEHAPKSVLAAIIISAVYRMLCQIGDLKKFWLLSKLDAFIWIATFSGTIFLEMKYGLIMGVIAALLVISYHFCNPHSYILGGVPGTEVYLPQYRFNEIKEVEKIKIFRFEGGINFASKQIFKDHLYSRTKIDAKQIVVDRKKALRKLKPGQELPELEISICCIILDFSAVTHVDPAGITTLKNVARDYNTIGIKVLICCVSDTNCAKLENYDKVEQVLDPFTIFLSIHDAVLYAKKNIIPKP